MSQTLDDYIAKMAAVDAARNAVNHLIDQLRSVVSPLLGDWRRVTLLLPGQSTPMEMSGQRQAIDALSGIPNLIDIHKAMVNHFQAHAEAQ